MDFTIEEASDGDLESILRVLETANMHHIPSREMPELELSNCFVAKAGGKIVGIAGFRMLPDGRGKTTVMAVAPEFQNNGIGHALQVRRIRAMEKLGAKLIITNADRAETIDWYKRHFGYREIGKLRKLHDFGDSKSSHWTTLEMDVLKWRRKHGD